MLFFLVNFRHEHIIVEKCFIFVLFDISVSQTLTFITCSQTNTDIYGNKLNLYPETLSYWFFIPLCLVDLAIQLADFTYFSYVSIYDFEQVNTGWVTFTFAVNHLALL